MDADPGPGHLASCHSAHQPTKRSWPTDSSERTKACRVENRSLTAKALPEHFHQQRVATEQQCAHQTLCLNSTQHDSHSECPVRGVQPCTPDTTERPAAAFCVVLAHSRQQHASPSPSHARSCARTQMRPEAFLRRGAPSAAETAPGSAEGNEHEQKPPADKTAETPASV